LTEVSLVSWARRRGVRQQVLEAVALAQAQNLPNAMVLILESRRRKFVESFDAIDDSAPDEVWRAVEEAFHLGKTAAMVDIVAEKRVERARQKIASDGANRARKNKGPSPVERAVREVMAADPTITGSEHHVPGIKPKIDAIVGKPATESTIWRYTKKVARERK
jgi:hypothetical protein